MATSPKSQKDDLSKGTQERDSQTLTLPDGRTLGFAEYGASSTSSSTTEPAPPTLLYLHGYPSSRLEASFLPPFFNRLNQTPSQSQSPHTNITSKLHILSLDRPGFGLSSPNASHTISSHSSDVLSLLRHLNIPRVTILAVSGGGPFALGCAKNLPSEMLSRVGIVSGGGPWHGDLEANGKRRSFANLNTCHRRLLSVWARWSPASLKVVLNGLVKFVGWVMSLGFVSGWIERFLEEQSKENEEKKQRESRPSDPASSDTEPLLSSPVAPDGDVANSRGPRLPGLLNGLLYEPFSQGAGGAVQEARLLSSPWDFNIADITYGSDSNPILLWHGEKDGNSPLPMTKYMAQQIPHCDLTVYEGENHYVVLSRHLTEIMSRLVPQLGLGNGVGEEKGVKEGDNHKKEL